MDDPHFSSDFKTHPWDSEAAQDIKESAQHIHQHTQHKICPVCGDTGWVIVFEGSPTIPCQCPQGKLRASA